MPGIARFLSKPWTVAALVFCGQALHRFDVDVDETGPLQQQPHSMNPDRGKCA
jgi:hypothetical protein